MIDGLKAYPSYKDSGVPWLGEVPESWELERAKWLFDKMERPARDHDEVVTCFRDGVVTLRKNRRVRGFTESLKEIGYQGVRTGDLVIHAMDAFAGAVGVADSDGKGTPVYSVCRPRPGTNAHFYAFLVREMARSQWIAALAKGIRERSTDFRYDGFAAQVVPVPPLPEQSAIVRFLDHADRRIRRYIRAKQKLIGLLDEQKQAIIHRAVTRGLDPNVRLKPSGVEWPGEVPEHWEVRAVRRLITFITSGSRGWAAHYRDEGDLFIQSGNLGRSLSLDLDRVQRVSVPPGAEGRRTQVVKDDILICITGALTGNVAFVDDVLPPAYVNQHVALVRPDPRSVLPRFLAYALHARYSQDQFKLTEYGGTKQGLGLDDVRDVLVLLPGADEQHRIVAALDAEAARSRKSIAVVEREISLLGEYRTRLIADVVTGKVDVREAAARLPEEVEPEEVEEAEGLAEGEESVSDDGGAGDGGEDYAEAAAQ